MTLGDKLKELREEKELTTREMSKILNIGKSTFSNYENDVRRPDYDTLSKIADYFDVSIDYLLGRTTIKNLPKEDKRDHTIPIAAHFKGKEMTEEQRKRIEKFIEFTLNEDD